MLEGGCVFCVRARRARWDSPEGRLEVLVMLSMVVEGLVVGR